MLKKQFSITVALLLAAGLPLVTHIFLNSLPAVHQHTFLSIIFLLPLAAYFLATIFERKIVFGGLITLVVLAFTFTYSQGQIKQLENSWPNTNSVTSYLRSNTSNHEIVLSSTDDITTLALDNLPENNIVGVFNFSYKNLSGNEAYELALKEGYFNFVLFNQETDEELGKTIRDSLTNHYAPVYDSGHDFIVYKSNAK